MKKKILSILILLTFSPGFTHAFVDTDGASIFLQVGTSTPTTTPTTTPPSGGGGSGNNSRDDLDITLRTVSSTDTSVSFSWTTNYETRTKVDWGRTPDYELGSISRIAFATSHQREIEGLLPNTRYYIRITSQTRLGERAFKEFVVTTLSTEEVDEDLGEPLNPIRFEAERIGDDVALTWRMLSGDDVRVVRSDIFYPADPNDGKVVFDGRKDLFLDEDVPLGDLYYTLFARNERGEYSSGIVAFVPRVDEPGFPTVPEIELDPAGPQGIELSLSDLLFLQNGERLGYIDDTVVPVDASLPLTIMLRRELLPNSLKTIVVTIRDPRESDRAFRFLMRTNKERDAYIATLAPIGAVGASPIEVDIMNYSNRSQFRLEGELNLFTKDPSLTEKAEDEEGNPYRFLSLILMGALGYTTFKLSRINKHVTP